MERRGQLHRLLEGGILSWTLCALPAFCERYGISEEEWAPCEAAWPASEQAQRYGLAGQQRQWGFNVDYGLASARTKEVHARRSARSRGDGPFALVSLISTAKADLPWCDGQTEGLDHRAGHICLLKFSFSSNHKADGAQLPSAFPVLVLLQSFLVCFPPGCS